MRNNKCIYLSLLWVALFSSIICFASEAKNVMPEFTYGGKTLSEFAGVEDAPSIEGYSAYAINLNSGTVIFEKNSHDMVYPASTVKLMTAIVAYENIYDLDADIIASESAVKMTQGGNIRIEAGEIYSARELLYGLLVGGANDAALVLAEHVAGSQQDFVKMMNEKASEIGAIDTHFVNVTGFHDDAQITTARDVAIIAQYFYYIPELFEMSNTTRFESDRIKRILTNRNLLLSRVSSDEYFYSSADGMSVGSTPEGGQCIVSTVTKDDNLTYLCVVMNSKEIDDKNYAYIDIKSIFDFCTENFRYHTVASTDTLMSEMKVNNAVDVDSFALFPDNDVKMLLPNNLDPAKDITYEKRLFSESADAPINIGDEFGEVVVKYRNDVIVGRAKLVSDVSLDKSNVLYFLSKVEKIITGKWFIAFIVTAVVLFAVYFGFSVHYKYFRKSKYTGNRLRK